MDNCYLFRAKILCVIVYVLIVMILTSCVSGPRHSDLVALEAVAAASEVMAKTYEKYKSMVVSSHVWQYLDSYGKEYVGYATYSYVLAGRNNSNQKSTSLYHELVEAIQALAVDSEKLQGLIPSRLLNLFIIPITNGSDHEGISPNYELSKLLLASLSTTLPLKFSRPGPYIITLYKPIGVDNGDEMTDILYVDLTDIHQKAIPEIVRTYSEKVIDDKLEGMEKLESLRLSLLNIALHVEDSIGFAKLASMSMKSAFEE